MKRKKVPPEKASPGTLLAARARADGNKWTDAEREKLGDQFLKLYYGGETKPGERLRVPDFGWHEEP
jgi:hypothetical protein